MNQALEKERALITRHKPNDIVPELKSAAFPVGKIQLIFKDGRELTLPIAQYPPIAKLTLAQRCKFKILGGIGIMFEDTDYVFHVSDFLGTDTKVGM
jgi:hypothetical protein